MTKDDLDLDEELNNENLDFLEDDDTHHIDSKGNATLPYKPPFSFNNLPKQLLMIAGIVIIGMIILGVIINSKKKHHAINVIPKQISTTNTGPSNNNNNNKTHNISIEHQEHPAVQPPTHASQPIHQDLQATNPPEHNTTTTSIAPQIQQNHQATIQNAPTLQDPQLSQIGQIKQTQPATTNTSPEQVANNNLTWQELKKSIDQNQNVQPTNAPNPQVPIQNNPGPNTTPNNLEINVPVGGFERTATTSQIAQSQANNNYKAQEQHIQELKTIITNITQELTANVNQIKELQNNLRDISRSISNVNSSVTGVDSKILNLTNTVDNLSMDVKNVKKYIQEEDLDLTANLKPSEPDLFSNTPEYVVHAVIPGRAWLKSSSGQIITITEGDSLGDYGKIALIDAANNIVRTSSGVVFR